MKRSLILFFLVTGCGAQLEVAGSRTQVGENNSKYQYSFEVNGCKTGEQKFKTKSEMCSALKDDSKNNNCAKAEREEKHKNEC